MSRVQRCPLLRIFLPAWLLVCLGAFRVAAAPAPANYAEIANRVLVVTYPNGVIGSFRVLPANTYEAAPSEGFATKRAEYSTAGQPEGTGVLVLSSTVTTGGVTYQSTNRFILSFLTTAGGTYRKEFLTTGVPNLQVQEGPFELSSGPNIAPRISLPPQGGSLKEGSRYNLGVVSIGFDLSYRWFHDGALVPGATAPGLLLNAVDATTVGAYVVEVSNALGKVTSAPVTVDLLTPPVLRRSPVGGSVFEGATVRLASEVDGRELNYAWTYNGIGLSAPNEPTLVLSNVTAAQSGLYRVRISNGAGTVDADPARLLVCATQTNTLYRGRAWTKIVHSGDAVPGYSNVIGTLKSPFYPLFTLRDRTVHLVVRGDNDGAVNDPIHRGLLRWRDGELSTLVFTNTARPGGVLFDDVFYPTDEEDGAVNFASGSMYELRGGQFREIIGTNTPAPGRDLLLGGPGSFARRGSAVAIAAAIAGGGPGTVTGAGIYLHDGVALSRICDETTDLPGVLPGYAFRPTEDSINFDGTTIVFSTIAGPGGAGGVFRSTRDGVITKLVDTGDRLPGLTNAVVSFGDVDVEGGTVFAVVGINTAVPPRVTIQNRVVAFFPDGDVQVLGSGDYLVAGGSNLVWFGTTSQIFRWENGASAPVIDLSAVLDCRRVDRFFDVEAQGDDVAIGVQFKDGTVGVYATFGGPWPGAPRILVPPRDTTIPATTPGMLAVAATGEAPLAYRWWHRGALVTEATGPVLAIPSAADADAGEYEVEVSNAAGSVRSSPATVSLGVAPSRPLIFAQPFPATVPIGSAAELRVLAAGAGPLTYQWRQGVEPIPGATGPTLALVVATNTQFTVVIANASGAITSQVSSINVQPILDRVPQSQRVDVGATVTFSVAVSGFPSYRYIWLRDSVAVAGGTNATLVLENVQTTAAGDYSVLVLPTGGSSVRSPVAKLTVGGDPQPQAVTLGRPVLADGALQLTFGTAAGVTYEIQRRVGLGAGDWTVARSIPGDGTTVSVPLPTEGEAAFYRVAARR